MIKINEQYQQTTGLIQISINNTNLFVDWCYCGRDVFFERVFVVYKFVLDGEQFLAKQTSEIE